MSEAIHFCGHCEALKDTAPLADRGWGIHALDWHLAGGMPGIALEALAKIVAKACASWTKHCNLTLSRVSAVNLAHIRMVVARIDGPRGILGQSELPPARPVHQQYDQAEDWTGQISPQAVIAHELGHALGLQHDPRPGSLMSAYYDPRIIEPQANDIERIRALYGWPVPVPPPTPAPGEDETDVMVILGKSGSEKIRYRLVWIPTPDEG